MQEEYTFVTLDGDDAVWTDAVIVDVDSDSGFLSDAIIIEEEFDNSDFITISDDTVMLSDADMLDMSSPDLNLDSDISIIL